MCLLPIVLFLGGASVLAQENLYIAGTVTDSKGVAIPGAGVCILAGANKLAEQMTDIDGSFRFENVQPGAYTLTTEIVGFVKFSKEEVNVLADSSLKLAIHLEPIPRPPTPAVLPRAAKQETEQTLDIPSFQSAAVTDLPGLNQFQQGISQEQGTAGGAADRGDSYLFISGNAANLDAGSLSDPGFRGQMMDVARQMGFQIQEFSPGGGGSGRGSGEMGDGIGGGPGGGMGFANRMGRGGRGANFKQPLIEGSVTETYSNSALNARNYSLTGQTLDKPVQIGNNFSLTLGGAIPFLKTKSANQGRSSGRGPVSQPGWSFTYSGSRNRSAQDILTTVPTDLERAGDFSQTYVQTLSLDPNTGQQTEGKQLVQLYRNPNDPSSRFTAIDSMDSIASGLLEFIPRANLPCASNAPCVNNYAMQRSLPTASDEIQAGVSGLRLSSKDSIGINYSMRRGSSLSAATFPGLDTDRTNFGQNLNISGNHSFKSRLFANWRIALNRMRMESTNAFSSARNVEGVLGITGVSTDPINWGPPTIDFSNYGNIALAAPSLTGNQTLTASGGINKMLSKHSIRAGIDASWAQRNSQSDSNGRGTFRFTGYATILFDAQGRQVSGTGHDFADFLLGSPYATSRRYVDSNVNPQGNGIYLRNRSWNMYVMDNWRVRSNLTFNYGLRYEYAGPFYEKYNRMVSLDESSNFTDLAQVFPDRNGPLSDRYFSRSLVNPDRNNFAPRVGIAWRPKNSSPFVLRAGYGISYNSNAYSSIAGQLINQSPFAVTQDLASDRSNPLTIQNGFPTNPVLTVLNTFGVDPGYKPSYAQQWNLDIQTQFSKLYVLSVSYSGSKGTGLDIVRAPNRSSNAGYFTYQTNGASSIYHGFNAQLSRRFSHGFNIINSYTLSKSIDSSSGSGGATVAQNDSDLAAERSLSSQDQRHNFQTNGAYELPIGQNRKYFAGASPKLLNIISGWTFSANLTIASGNPLSPRYASSNGSASSAALYNSLRPDATGLPISLPSGERTAQEFFNSAAFSIPAGQFGDAGRNIIPGPGSSTLNMSVRKGFRLDENSRRLDLSWQVQNLLNHPNWSGVSTTVNALNFGRVTGVRAMRSMTFNLRLRF
jgi:trimeric autotransporter adhesin